MDISMIIEKDIRKAKVKLINKARKTGIYENFGQKEVRELNDKYYNYTLCTPDNLINQFDRWCMNFNDLDDLITAE